MFDLVSYQKWGRILHMLRHFVGDEAFYTSLNKYLTDNKFSNGSAIKLKLAFEAVTGKDLNWFFNQWYFGNGHPYIRITQQYNPATKQIMVKLSQTQVQNKLFELPVGIDIYVGGSRNHYEVWSKNKVDSFFFPAATAPDNVNVDNDKILLWEKNESKPFNQFIYQFYHARNFMDRNEALNEAVQNIKNLDAQQMIQDAMKDSFYIIRTKAIHSLNPASINDQTEKLIQQLAANDPSNYVREEAITFLGALHKEVYKDQFKSWANDSSYLVAGAALEALNQIDSVAALEMAINFSKTVMKKRLDMAVSDVLFKYGDESVFDFLADKYASYPMQSSEKFYKTDAFAQLLIKIKEETKFKRGIDLIVAFRESVPQDYRAQSDPFFNGKILGEILKAKKKNEQQNLVEIVIAVMPRI
jgi:aminopeptidase N